MFCDYSEIFGKVNEGIHSYRILNVAIIDVLFTFIGAYIIKKYIFTEFKYYEVLFGLFLLGIILHRIFCVRTTIDRLIFN